MLSFWNNLSLLIFASRTSQAYGNFRVCFCLSLGHSTVSIASKGFLLL